MFGYNNVKQVNIINRNEMEEKG